MPEPYVGEIRMFAGNYAPVGWELCNGQLLPISENETLFTIIGTTYGGDGESTFGLPNLMSRVPVHMTSASIIGEQAGVEEVTLTTQQMPVHTHPMLASEGVADQVNPAGNLPAEATKRFYVTPGTPGAMAPQAVAPAGGGQPHNNMQPYLVINFIISLFGYFPSAT